jgi:hypothetical protein
VKKYTIIALLLFSLVLNFNCISVRETKKEILGSWLLEDFKVGEKSIVWQSFTITVMFFYEDGTCKLPSRNSNLDRNANWYILKKKNKLFVKIENAKDEIFNDTYSINLERRGQYMMKVKILELKTDSLTIKLTTR